MKIVLLLLWWAFWGFGFLIFSQSKSAIHEIEALLFVISGTLCLGFCGVIDAIKSTSREEKPKISESKEPVVKE